MKPYNSYILLSAGTLISSIAFSCYGMDQQPPIIRATLEGNSKQVKSLLDAHTNPDTPSKHDHTALMFASHKGFSTIVQLLLAHGANPNARDEYKDMALISAADRDHTKIIKMLLEAGANPFELTRNNKQIIDVYPNVKKIYDEEIYRKRIVPIRTVHAAEQVPGIFMDLPPELIYLINEYISPGDYSIPPDYKP